MFYLIIGVVIGIFIPAPYDTIAKNFLSATWQKVRSWFDGKE